MIHFIKMGNLKLCQYLFSRGADYQKIDILFGLSPMLIATKYSYFKIIQLLYHDGDTHHDIQRIIDKHGSPPLSAALHYYHVDVAQLLILNKVLAPLDDDEHDVGDGIIDTNIQLFLKGTILSLSTFCCHPKNVYSTRSKQTKLSLSSFIVTTGNVSEQIGYPRINFEICRKSQTSRVTYFLSIDLSPAIFY